MINPKNIIFKTRNNRDVKPFVHPIYVRRIGIKMPPKYVEMTCHLVKALAEQTGWLVANGIVAENILDRENNFKKQPSRNFFLDLLKKYGKDGGRDNLKNKTRFEAMARVATCIKLQHLLELVETQGINAALDYVLKLKQKYGTEPSKSSILLFRDRHFRDFLDEIERISIDDMKNKFHHPKLPVVTNIVTQFLLKAPGSRILIFAKYRASISNILDYFREKAPDLVRASKFVGQAARSKNDKGMRRDMQQETLNRFKKGEFNVLVATSVAEEGLDIAECDLVIFYEMVTSIIKFIQRQGRTGRKRAGNVVMLFTIGTMDEFRMKVLDLKLIRLKHIYLNASNIAPVSDLDKVHDTNANNVIGTKEKIIDDNWKAVKSMDNSRSQRSSRYKKHSADKIQEFFETNNSNSNIKIPISIKDLKKWQDDQAISINPNSPLASELSSELKKAGIKTVFLPSLKKNIADLVINRIIVIKIKSLDDLEDLLVSNQLYHLLATVRKLYKYPILIAWNRTTYGLNPKIANEFVLDWIKKACKIFDVCIINLADLKILVHVINDIKKNFQLKLKTA
ncbi:MAG: helicase-related protein [Promethearchaeota archaeon]